MAGRPLRVLMLEDRPEDAELVLHELRRAGFELNWRRVEDEAGFKANLDPELDLVLADYHQPQFNAMRALKIMQQAGLDIPFVIVSGAIGEDMAVAAVRQGAMDFGRAGPRDPRPRKAVLTVTHRPFRVSSGSSGIIHDIATIRIVRVLATPLVALLLATACQPVAQSGPASSPTGSARASVTPSPTPAPKPVFVIVLENTSYQAALRQPYIASLAKDYAVATNYAAIANPSLPNYLAMTSGSTWGITDDAFHRLPATGLGNELTAAGISWKAYMEGFTGDCFNSPYPYALKHNPFAYYGGTCPANVVPMTDLATDLNGDTPQLSWITPGMCNDGHDCGVARADRWLAQFVPLITSSSAWKQGGVLFVTWDESSAQNPRVALLVVAPGFHGQLAMALNHYSLLATIADRLGVARLGEAKQATSLQPQLAAGMALR